MRKEEAKTELVSVVGYSIKLNAKIKAYNLFGDVLAYIGVAVTTACKATTRK
jgi:hypothetical protein